MAERQRGFTLIELIVVIHVIGIVAAVAVPNLMASRRSANGASAVEATRLFHSTEVTYHAGVGNSSFGGAEDLFRQDFIDAVHAAAAGVPLASESLSGKQPDPASGPGKSGYNFTVTFTPPGGGKLSTFTATATPVAVHRTGDRSFFIDETGILLFTCSPPKHFSDETKRCEPHEEVTDGVAVAALSGLDGLSLDGALKRAIAEPPDPDRVQKVLSLMDANGDRMLTLHEVVKADVLSIAQTLAGTTSDSKKPQAGDRLLDRLLKQFKGDLERELALGVGNEDEIALPFVEIKGEVVPLLELATRFTSPIKR